MAPTNPLFFRWGAIFFPAVGILCQLPLWVASSDSPDSDPTEVLVSPSDCARKSLQHTATSNRDITPENAPSLGAPIESNTNSTTQEVPHLPGPSGTSFDLDDEDDASGPATRGRRSRSPAVVRRIATRARRRSGCQGRFAVVRRIIALLAILFFSALAGGILYNFKPLAGMMAQARAYEELCPRNTSSSNGTRSVPPVTTPAVLTTVSANNETLQPAPTDPPKYACDAQEARLEGLYTLVFASSSIASVLAGPMNDCVGSRWTSFGGHLSEVVGMLLFAFEQYAPGLALVAAGQEVAFLASLSVSQMFPQSAGLILGLLGSLASLSGSVPVLLKLLVTRFCFTLQHVMVGYATVVSFPALLAGISLLPRKQRAAPTDDRADTDPSRLETNEDTVPSADESDPTSPSTPITAGPSQGTPECAGESARLPQRRGALRRILGSLGDYVANPVLRENIFSVQTLVITFNFVIASVTSAYFIQGAERIFFGPAGTLLEAFSPAAALPCALLGLIPDRLGASMASFILAVAGLTMNGTSFVSSTAAGYAGLTALTVYISALTSQIHWICYEAYPCECRGMVMGLILSTGGALSLCANWLYSTVTLGMFGGDTFVVRATLAGFQFLQLILIAVAYRQIRMRTGGEDRLSRTLRRLLRPRRYSLRARERQRELLD